MQRLTFQKGLILFLAFFAACPFLSGFTSKPGGDSYEIRLNNKVILKQFVHQPLEVKTLALNYAGPNDQLTVYYSHCGVTGKERTIAVRDSKNKILKKWSFKDAGASDGGMVLPVKDLVELEKSTGSGALSVCYSAKELPEGRTLVSLRVSEKSLAYHQHPNPPFVTAGNVLRILFN